MRLSCIPRLFVPAILAILTLGNGPEAKAQWYTHNYHYRVDPWSGGYHYQYQYQYQWHTPRYTPSYSAYNYGYNYAYNYARYRW